MEFGLQIGGTYCHGSGCGLPISYFPSYADFVSGQIPSFTDLQNRVTVGYFGKKVAQNLHHLKAAEIRTELLRCGVPRVSKLDRTVHLQTLRDLLKGVERVPAVLTQTPCVSPEVHGLSNYQAFPSELLHDIKGHISDVITELSHHCPQEIAEKIRSVTESTVNPNHSRGCEGRKALMILAKELQDEKLRCPPDIKRMVELLMSQGSCMPVLHTAHHKWCSIYVLPCGAILA